ncbi:class I SAM-dependent methyltransferase, partial [Caulobacter sp.]|uniref:class I SAM-dependent methyltransferase n=1 Tax=Caulobacter sp. TaxID=78 RepID=UPI001B28360C
MRSFQKLDMASTDWLTTHFLAKSPDRSREINGLDIPQGARVLDLCCGPGLFIPLLLNLVGPTGHVTGVDQDPMSLDAAHARLVAQPHRNWTLQQARLEDFIDRVADFDIVLLFNCIGYFGDPVQVIRNLACRLRPGSRIIVKDFDLEGFFFQPRRIAEWATLLEAAKLRNDHDNPV